MKSAARCAWLAAAKIARSSAFEHVKPVGDVGGVVLARLKRIEYYERSRTHLALDKDAPISRAVSPTGGRIIAIPQVGGLHHRYERTAA